ncbi:MAG: thioesterase family protein [Pseudomonadota bacterium]
MPYPTEFEAKPIQTREQKVLPEWIDYNGHMNVAFYTMAFDKALDEVFDEVLGVGEEQACAQKMGPMALQSQLHYLAELKLGEAFNCEFQILEADHKRIHFFTVMRSLSNGGEAATYESISMNVDLIARRSAPYPDDAMARIQAVANAHAALPQHAKVGATIGIRRKG